MKPRMQWSIALLACSSAIWIAACTTRPKSIELGSPELPKVAVVGAGKTITVVHPQDMRPDPGIIGRWLGVSSRETVTTDTDLAVWVGNAVVSSLEQAGYRLERTERVGAAPSAIAITVSITDAEAEFGPSGWGTHGEARVVAKFQIYKRGEPVFARTFSGTSSTEAGGPTREQYQQLLNRALSGMLRQAIPTVITVVLREEPEL